MNSVIMTYPCFQATILSSSEQGLLLQLNLEAIHLSVILSLVIRKEEH